MNDRIVLRGIEVYCYHGVHMQEKQLGQRFVVDVVLFGDFSVAARSDSLDHAVDYSKVHSLVVKAMQNGSFDLIERAAGHLCFVLLKSLDIGAVEVTVEKTNPPIPGFTGQAAVILRRDRRWLTE